jgi:hypothetical protein
VDEFATPNQGYHELTKLFESFRSRESRSNAESELLSSTSENVCELWSGREIVRALGNPEGMKELIVVDTSRAKDTTNVRVLDLKQAVQEKYLRCDDEIEPEALEKLANEPPNITLNIKGSTASFKELWIWAIVGLFLQLFALLMPGLATYYWQWPKGERVAAAYGYPCFVVGTIAVAVGMMFCSHVIEGSTTEREFNPSLRKGAHIRRILRLQKTCTVSEQVFPSFAILNSSTNNVIRTSRVNEKKYRYGFHCTLSVWVSFTVKW